MNIFIDAVSSNGIIILFDNDRNIISSQNINVVANESSLLVNILDDFIKNNKINYSDLENIVVVNGPGSFTGIRAIVLIVNTINFVIKKSITPIGYFDLFNNFPIIKPSSKRDLFVKFNKNDKIEILTNEDFLDTINREKINKIYGDIPLNFPSSIKVKGLDSENYEKIIKNIEFKDFTIIEPLYIKKPLIS